MPSSTVFTPARTTTLCSSIIVALSSGTNYVYSAYAPQLASRLNISHTQLNLVGLAGNMGVYSSGPFWGRLVDRNGPRPLFVAAAVLLFVGYSGIRHFYDAGLGQGGGDGRLGTMEFGILLLCGYMSGAGGNAGLTSAVNATALSFPDRARATTTGLVLSGFGLSAFLFSTLAHTLYPGNTSSLLLSLSIGTAFPMVLGFFFVRPVGLPAGGLGEAFEMRGEEQDEEEGGEEERDVRVGLLRRGDSDVGGYGVDDDDDEEEGEEEEDKLEPGRGRVQGRKEKTHPSDTRLDVHGKKLFTNLDFWLLFSIMALLSGTGLMYINNVGSIAQALLAQQAPAPTTETATATATAPATTAAYDAIEAATWQAAQVSTISVANCLGRIAVGLSSDLLKTHLNLPRTSLLPPTSLLFLLSQLLLLLSISSVRDLWKASAVLGWGYGWLFGVGPVLCVELFGIPHFSENWGLVHVSPMIGGNLFSIAFGWNLDAHSPPLTSTPPSTSSLTSSSSASTSTTLSFISALLRRAGAGLGLGLGLGATTTVTRQCVSGRACYDSSLNLTIAACLGALVLSVWAAWRDRRRQLQAQLRSRRV